MSAPRHAEFFLRRLTRFFVALAAAGFLLLIAAGARHYSTLLESLMQDPLVSEWKGPAQLRVGQSPLCAGVPCWALPVVPNDGPSDGTGDFWRQVDVPHVGLAEQFRAAQAHDQVFYRFEVLIPPTLARSGEEISFSPNWVVHRRYEVFVDGVWVASGHGSTASGDIIYQKVVVPLPKRVAAAGRALVVIAADVTPSDLGIQHLGKILVGPTTALGRLHVEAEFAMGSYYLLFLAAEGAIFVFFALTYLLATTAPAFGIFVVYAFLMASIHLTIGNFLEGLVPFSARIWLYFLAKGGAATALALFLGNVAAPKLRARRALRAAAALPLGTTIFVLAMQAKGAAWATIAALHDTTGYGLYAVVGSFVLASAFTMTRGSGARGVGPLLAGAGYFAFLTWSQFVHGAHAFDYRPLADLGFFYYVAWLTLKEFGVAQAKARIMTSNWQRLFGVFGRLVGKKLATHLTVTGDVLARGERAVTLMLVDVRHTNRLLKQHGEGALVDALDAWIALLGREAEKTGGEIHKIMGDKALLAWNLTGDAPVDGAAASTTFAVALRQATSAWNEERVAERTFLMTWSSAIVTGRAIVGRLGGQDGGRSDFTVFGPLVNRAFEQLAVAKRSAVDVTIDRRTILAAGGALVYEQLAGQAASLVGRVDRGVVSIGLTRWAQEFTAVTQGGRVFGAGGNQEIFVPETALDEDDKAA